MLKTFLSIVLFCSIALANTPLNTYNLTHTFIGVLALIIAIITYVLVIFETKIQLDKSISTLFFGFLLFIIFGIYFQINHLDILLVEEKSHILMYEMAEIFFFLFVSMTYLQTLTHLNVFKKIGYYFVSNKYTYKKFFWIIGVWSFFLSALLGGLICALIMSTLLFSMFKDKKTVLIPMAVNIIIAVNAGGIWSSLGSIITTMVWIENKINFYDFFLLFPASFIGYIFSAYLLSFFVPKEKIYKKKLQKVHLKKGAKVVVFLSFFSLFCSILFYYIFSFPAMWGMMFGLALLYLYAHFLKYKFDKEYLNIFDIISKIEYPTLMFFLGILAILGALDFTGWLGYISMLYENLELNNRYINIFMGLLGAFINNIPVTSVVLQANVQMSQIDWLFFTLCVGMGSSVLSIGSIAGIIMMGKLKGTYTFFAHLKYFWIVLVGYFISILVYWVVFY